MTLAIFTQSYFVASARVLYLHSENGMPLFVRMTAAMECYEKKDDERSPYFHGTNSYPLEEMTSSSTDYYVYGPTGLIAFVNGGATYFVLKDHLPSKIFYMSGWRKALMGSTQVC